MLEALQRVSCCIVFAAVLVFSLAPSARATDGAGCTPSASVFCVTNTNDTTDTGSANYAGSLRKAIADSNAAGGTNMIGFQIPGSGVHTITLAAQLPAISTNLTIDGFTQPGSVPNTNTPDQGGLNAQLMIEIVGSSTGTPGFTYACCAGPFLTLTFEGLVIHGFGVAIAGQGNTPVPKAQINVYGCYIGTKPDGTALATIGNGDAALRVNYDNAQVGGTLPQQRNLLSGNGLAGVFSLASDATSSVIIEGNLIGTDASGTVAIPNGTVGNWPGVYLFGTVRGVRIGCTSAGNGCSSHASRNVISGNRPWAIGFAPNGVGTPYVGLEVKGNYIGVATNGAALPNGWPDVGSAQYGGGIQISDSSDTTPAIIGGFGPGEANLIAFNHGPGINLLNTTGYFETRANQVHDNTGVGSTNVALAQFAANEPLANDAGDADTGSNFRQNFPEVLTAEPMRASGQVFMNVTYRVTSDAANSTYPIRVDFHFAVNGGAGVWFAQDSYPSSAGQGYVTASLPIDPSIAVGTPWFSFWGPLVAIATSASGYSSEISPVTNDWIFGDDYDGP
jgi:hypothetical protein